MSKIEGNFLILHPTNKYEIEEIELNKGIVNIVSYSDGSIIVQIMEEGRPITVWANKRMQLNESTNEITLLND